MYCGRYAEQDTGKDEPDIYIAYNMFWEPIQFGVPSARNKKEWKVAFSTDVSKNREDTKIERMYTVPARSITVLIAE
jgi:glycogen operon protein